MSAAPSLSRYCAADLDQGVRGNVLSGTRLLGTGRESPGDLSARLAAGLGEARAPRSDLADSTRRGVAVHPHTSLLRQDEDVCWPVNADDCSAYRIPLHLLIPSAGCRSLHCGAC
jgi:hypothetical protein